MQAELSWLPRGEIGAREDPPIVVASLSEGEPQLRLRATRFAEHVQDEGGEGNGTSRSRCLRRLRSRDARDRLDTRTYAELSGLEINVAPSKPEQFPAAQTGADGDGDRGLEIRLGCRREQRCNAGGIKRTHLFAFDARRFAGVDWVAHQQPHTDAPSADRAQGREEVCDRALRELAFLFVVSRTGRPSRDRGLNVSRPKIFSADLPERWPDVESRDRCVTRIGFPTDPVFRRLEPHRYYIRERFAIAAARKICHQLSRGFLRLAGARLEQLVDFKIDALEMVERDSGFVEIIERIQQEPKPALRLGLRPAERFATAAARTDRRSRNFDTLPAKAKASLPVMQSVRNKKGPA